MIGKIGHLFAISPQQGALTSLYVATSSDIESKNFRGEYFVPTAKLDTPSEFARNEQLLEKLWDFSEKLLQEKLPSNANPPQQQEVLSEN